MFNSMHILESIIAVKVRQTIAKANKSNFYRYDGHEPLKILIIGYSGKRNIGAEARCAEIINEIEALNLTDQIEIGLLTLDPEASRPFYPNHVKLIPLSSIFFNDLLAACREYHVGILVEGSCFTGVTSNVAAMYFICATGILSALGKPVIAYGVEAGPMPKKLIKLLQQHSKQLLFIARTNTAEQIAKCYHLTTDIGTDTAWSIKPMERAWALSEMKRRWQKTDGKPLLGISAMNAYIRPIRPRLIRYLFSRLRNRWHDHYDKFYFYTNNKKRRQLYQHYLKAIAKAINNWVKATGGIPVLIEMEPMDKACLADLAKLIPKKHYYLAASDYNAVEMTSILRELDLLVTTRYHAHVLSMPAGVPCVAISKDQRLKVIFDENELAEYCISTFDNDIESLVDQKIKLAWQNRTDISKKLKQQSVEFLKKQHDMRKIVGSHLQRVFSYVWNKR